ncbi:MAG: GNAT family N-acetyltransferase [Desulfomonilia bacterium]|jgi:GNAT superfamily N-acetyltransferase
MEEGLGSLTHSAISIKMNADEFNLLLLGSLDMKQVSETPGVKETEEILLERLERGWLCLGLMCGTRIIAHMWCNTRECDSNLYPFLLDHDEAYLSNALTVEEYRGRGIAPYLRLQFYKHLHGMGCYKIYSITEYFNISAMRFKQKLGAKPILLLVKVYFLNKYSVNILLKRYKK